MLWLHRVEPARPGGLLLYRVQRYRGPARDLADGTRIARGDPIIELHLANRRLNEMRRRPGYQPWRAVSAMRGDVEELGRAIAAGRLGPVTALHGVALMGAAGGRLGFEAHELHHTWQTAFVRYFMAGIDAVYHPAGLGRLDGRARSRWPVEVWMSAVAAARDRS